MIPGVVRMRIARAMAVMALAGWVGGAALASAVRSEPQLSALPWAQIAIGVLISGWGGATATLGRWLAAQYTGAPFHWRAEVVRDVAVSVCVGLGAYFAGATAGLSSMELGFVLLVCGLVGAPMLAAVGGRALAIVKAGKAGGGPNDDFR